MARAKAEIVEKEQRQFDMSLPESRYQVNKSELIKTIAELAQTEIEASATCVTIRPQGMRIVVELNNDVGRKRF